MITTQIRGFFSSLLVGIVWATAAAAQEPAEALGPVIASEDACGLSYDQAAIGAWIEANVAADDIEFTSQLSFQTQLASLQIEDMTSSNLTAHCAAITRVARHFGFVE